MRSGQEHPVVLPQFLPASLRRLVVRPPRVYVKMLNPERTKYLNLSPVASLLYIGDTLTYDNPKEHLVVTRLIQVGLRTWGQQALELLVQKRRHGWNTRTANILKQPVCLIFCSRIQQGSTSRTNSDTATTHDDLDYTTLLL